MLKEERSNISTTILIAKARWVFHCERCNVDHHKKKRINHQTALQKTNKRMLIIITNNFEVIRKQTEETITPTHNKDNIQES